MSQVTDDSAADVDPLNATDLQAAGVRVGFAQASDAAVWLGTLGMVLGRLEVFSLLVLLTPAFWRE